jgi:hypothetical protein
MGRTKRRKTGKRKNRKHRGLHGVTKAVNSGRAIDALKEGGLILLAGIAASGAGAAIGKHSLLVGIPVTIAGAYAKNKYIMAAGVGLALSNGFQRATTSSVSGVDGFDIKQIAQDAKDRVGTFFENFKEKLYIPATTLDTGTDGLGANDGARYFINPYSAKELDLSELERVEQQVAAMNQGTSGLEDIDREF